MLRFITFLFFLFFAAVSYAGVFYGSVQSIPKKIKLQMQGYTWRKGCPIPLSSMRYLTLSYYGFDHKDHIGHLIVLDSLALETLEIFQKLHKNKFPIEKMILPSRYKSKTDWPSTEDDNSLGFFCRKDDQSPNKFSAHSYGIAIDINPVYNPAAISKHKTQPAKGKLYMDRNLKHQGMISPGDIVFNTFTSYGWKWGGYWDKSEIDYMHFQKDMDHIYTCNKLTLTSKVP